MALRTNSCYTRLDGKRGIASSRDEAQRLGRLEYAWMDTAQEAEPEHAGVGVV